MLKHGFLSVMITCFSGAALAGGMVLPPEEVQQQVPMAPAEPHIIAAPVVLAPISDPVYEEELPQSKSMLPPSPYQVEGHGDATQRLSFQLALTECMEIVEKHLKEASNNPSQEDAYHFLGNCLTNKGLETPNELSEIK